jgi:broad specificity phosphatase PhoE
MTKWQIPPSNLEWLKKAPGNQPIVLLIRHTVRPESENNIIGHNVSITEEGYQVARQFGQKLGTNLISIVTSPVLRCVQTAEAILEGAKKNISIIKNRLLGDPSVYILDGQLAGKHLKNLKFKEWMRFLTTGREPLSGMAKPNPAARFLINYALAQARGKPGYHLFITHDSIISATVSQLLGKEMVTDDWPWYLESAFFWEDNSGTQIRYRDYSAKCDNSNGLTETDVIEFAKREIGWSIGKNCKARFFFAGGAFKTLLTGKDTKDIDIWAASFVDRKLLIETIISRGATLVKQTPFSEVFAIDEKNIEVSLKTESATLAERLGRFNIALSAVGVEFIHGEVRNVIIHPDAIESIENKKIILLKPLVNWEHSLGTLERMYKYSSELGYELPESEIQAIWNCFDHQKRETQVKMIEKFGKTTYGTTNIKEEALCRLK